MEEAATPFPREETTPPVTKIYFGFIRAPRAAMRGVLDLHKSGGTTYYLRNSPDCQIESFALPNREFRGRFPATFCVQECF